MDGYKLRVKIGDHEFEAEGPADVVKEQFELWKSLVTSAPPPQTPRIDTPPPIQLEPRSPGGQAGQAFTPEQLLHIISIDDKRDLVTLRILPKGEDRHREAILIVLYGYLKSRNIDEVVVTKLKSSLEASGSAPDRVDRAADPLLKDQLVVKGGSGKGGKYRLTMKGQGRAEELIRALLEQLV
ncbi:MAG: hypothetical protein HRU82_17415 [Nitrospira sp.]|nr:MAG: hypothetical protein HRU82_17415 [Nitrospira sp.]